MDSLSFDEGSLGNIWTLVPVGDCSAAARNMLYGTSWPSVLVCSLEAYSERLRDPEIGRIFYEPTLPVRHSLGLKRLLYSIELRAAFRITQ